MCLPLLTSWEPGLYKITSIGSTGADRHGTELCFEWLLQAQFAMYVFPGETLQTEMWHEGQSIIFQTRVLERDVLAITKAAIELRSITPARL